jgi:hypothetical protein
MCIPGLPQVNAPAKGRDNLLIANEGPSTPVKYDEDMKTFVPNRGATRATNIRLKNPPKGMV